MSWADSYIPDGALERALGSSQKRLEAVREALFSYLDNPAGNASLDSEIKAAIKDIDRIME